MSNHLINSREFLNLDPDRFHLFSAQYPNVTCVIFLQLCCWCLRFNLFFRAHKHILTMLKIIVNMLNALCIFLFALSPLASSDFPFRNVSLLWSERVDDLVGRLTLDQIVQQLARGGAGLNGGPAPAIENLGIGPYQWNTECLRGDVEAGNATSFPQAIGLAAAFRYSLQQKYKL